MPGQSKKTKKNTAVAAGPRYEWLKHHSIVLILGLVLVISLFLRFYDIGKESLWLDEALSIKESALSIRDMTNQSNQPPLYFLLLRGWIHLFGTGEPALRSLSAVFGILTVGLIFLAGRSLFSPRVGLIAAFLSSFSAFLIYHSQDIRAYSLLGLLAVVSYWVFIEILQRNKTWLYPAYLVSGLLLVYTHFYGLFIILSQVLYFLIFIRKYPEQRWKYFSSLAVLGIALIPFVLLLKNRITTIAGHGFWIARPGLGTLKDTFISFSGFGSTRDAVFILFVLLSVLGFFMIKQSESTGVPGKLPKRTPGLKWPAWLVTPGPLVLLVLWLLVSILVPFIESQFMTPIYQAKYAIGAFPAFCLLAAKGLDNIKWQWIFYPVLITIVVLSSVGLQSYYQNVHKEQWREVAQYVESNSRPDDVIVICEGYYQVPFDYYYRGNLREVRITTPEDAQKFIDSEKASAAPDQARLWLVLAYNKDRIIEQFVKAYGKESVDVARRYAGVTICRFNIAGSAK